MTGSFPEIDLSLNSPTLAVWLFFYMQSFQIGCLVLGLWISTTVSPQLQQSGPVCIGQQIVEFFAERKFGFLDPRKLHFVMFKGSDYRGGVRFIPGLGFLLRILSARCLSPEIRNGIDVRFAKNSRSNRFIFMKGAILTFTTSHWFPSVQAGTRVYQVYLRTHKKSAIQVSVKRLFFRSGASDGWHWASLGQDVIMKQAVPW